MNLAIAVATASRLTTALNWKSVFLLDLTFALGNTRSMSPLMRARTMRTSPLTLNFLVSGATMDRNALFRNSHIGFPLFFLSFVRHQPLIERLIWVLVKAFRLAFDFLPLLRIGFHRNPLPGVDSHRSRYAAHCLGGMQKFRSSRVMAYNMTRGWFFLAHST